MEDLGVGGEESTAMAALFRSRLQLCRSGKSFHLIVCQYILGFLQVHRAMGAVDKAVWEKKVPALLPSGLSKLTSEVIVDMASITLWNLCSNREVHFLEGLDQILSIVATAEGHGKWQK